MPTIPTGQMERELRKLYLRWLSGVRFGNKDMNAKVNDFQRRSQELIETMGGQTARLGALADFPAPKRLDLSPHVGTIYSDMQQAAIQASIAAGLNSTASARAMFNAGMDKSFHRLNRLARTETVSAYWKNAWDSVADLPLLVMVWGSEDGPRTCAWCRERDGLVMDSANLRDHPNGRCTPIPTLRSSVKYRGSISQDGKIYHDPDWNKLKGQQVLSTEEVFDGKPLAELKRMEASSTADYFAFTKAWVGTPEQMYDDLKYIELNARMKAISAARRKADDIAYAAAKVRAAERKIAAAEAKAKSLAARPSVAETQAAIASAKKVEEIGAALKTQFGPDDIRITGFTAKGMGTRSLDEVRGFAKSITRQLDETPALKQITDISIGAPPGGRGDVAMAWVTQVRGAGKVTLSNEFKGSYLDAVQRGQEVGWFHIPKGAAATRTVEDAVDYLTTHEVGHLVDNAGVFAARKSLDKDKPFSLDRSHTGHGHDHSQYAGTNSAECLAEAYATVRLYPEFATAAEKRLVADLDAAIAKETTRKARLTKAGRRT